ncbi:hypothetical protein WAF17_08275 [Bernardetia sp. ABR2-2B]|uniref:hypothetical protein n=1 Tax=Bernardetia sp. ABR2-2B TaxID=3127472 RepID=UPI0030D3AC7C
MKISFFALLIMTLILASCDENKENQNQANSDIVLNETPQVLEDKDNYEVRSISKRYDSDIVVELYNEALEKNLKLKQLNDEINQMYQTKRDSLAEYSKFSNTNEKYWMNARNHINQIQDSVLREATLETFKAIEVNYKNKMAGYEPKIKEIQRKDIQLNDQLILMKLFITESMMKNYQVNEQPTIKTLENIIDKYDNLIEETKEYTKMSK